MALATTARRGVTYRTAWDAYNRWNVPLLDFWDDFAEDGRLDARRRGDEQAFLAVRDGQDVTHWHLGFRKRALSRARGAPAQGIQARRGPGQGVPARRIPHQQRQGGLLGRGFVGGALVLSGVALALRR